MPKISKISTQQVSEKSTKSEILDAYKEVMSKLTEKPEDETIKEEKQIVDTAAKETVEKIIGDLSQLKISLSQTVGNLTEKLTWEAERLSSIRKATVIAQKELEDTQKVKITAKQLYDLITLQKKQEDDFKLEMDTQKNAWEEEKKQYEETKKRERTREEDEYEYNKKVERKRYQENWNEELKKHESQKQEETESREAMLKELDELRKNVETYPAIKEKEIKAAVAQALALVNKDNQIQQNFAKQKADSELELLRSQLISLKATLKSQDDQIRELKIQLEASTKHIKDIAISVVEGSKKEPPPQPPTRSNTQ
jgi:hypothetical protein